MNIWQNALASQIFQHQDKLGRSEVNKHVYVTS
jgi:hypothetical protein